MPIARDHYTAKWCLVYLVQRIGSQVGGRHPIQSPRPLVLVQKCPGLPGQQLSARRRRPCQTTAAVLETGPLPPQDLKPGTVCCPMSDYVGCHTASSGGSWRHFYSVGHGAVWAVLTALRQIETFLLTYLLITRNVQCKLQQAYPATELERCGLCLKYIAIAIRPTIIIKLVH